MKNNVYECEGLDQFDNKSEFYVTIPEGQTAECCFGEFKEGETINITEEVKVLKKRIKELEEELEDNKNVIATLVKTFNVHSLYCENGQWKLALKED